MSDFSQQSPKQQMLGMWIIWFAIPTGLFIMDRVAVSDRSVEEAAVVSGISLFCLVGIALVVVAGIIRWFLIPKLRTAQAGLVAMIVGLALSEIPGILSLFVVPAEHTDERTLLFVLSYASAVTFAPFYARRLCMPFNPAAAS